MPRSLDELLSWQPKTKLTPKQQTKAAKKPVEELLAWQPGKPQEQQGIPAPIVNKAREVMSRQLFGLSAPTISGGAMAGGARLISAVARGASAVRPGKGWDAAADWWSNYSNALIKATGEQQSSIVQRGATGALASAPTMAVTAPAGPWGMVAGGVVDQMNSAITEGRNEGLKGGELGAYVARQGMIEGAISGTMQKVGLGGLSRVIGGKAAVKQGVKEALKQQAKQGLKGTAKEVGRTFLEEDIEEVTINVLQRLNDKYSGVDPSSITLEGLLQDAAETTAVVAWSVGGGAGPIHIQESLRLGKQAKTEQAIVKVAEEGRTPSRKEWKDWGLDPKQGNTAKDRLDGVKSIAEELRNPPQPTEVVEQPQEPTEQTTQQEAIQEPTEAIPEVPQEEAVQPELPPEALVPPTQEEVIGEDVTGISKTIINDVRAKRGEAALVDSSPESMQEWVDAAAKEIQHNPMSSADLVQELITDPYNVKISPTQVGMLAIHYGKVNTNLTEAGRQLEDAKATNDPALIDRAQKHADMMLAMVRDTEKAIRIAGTEGGRVVKAFDLILKEDYTYAGMVRRASIANGERSLNDAQTAKINELELRLTEFQKKYNALLEAQAANEQETAIDALIDRSKPRKSFKRSPEKMAAANKAIQEAVKNFKRVLDGLPPEGLITGESGALNLEVIEAGYQVAKAYANLGVTSFTEFFYGPAKSMLGDQAYALREHLQQAWDKLTQSGEAGVLAISRDNPNSFVKESRKLLTAMVKAGVTDRNQIINEIHKEFQQVIPDVTRAEVIEAASGYGQFSKLNRSELSTRLRDMRGQLRQVAKLARIEAGLPEAQTGFERRELSQQEKDLVAQIKNAKKRLGLHEKERLSNYKKRLTKQIDEYARRIKEGDYSKADRSKLILDLEAVKLKYEMTKAKSEFRAMEAELVKKRWGIKKKTWELTKNAFNASRSLITSTDLSMIGRQGAFTTFAHPVLTAKAIPETLKAFWSQESEFEAAAKLRERANYALYEPSGLSITATNEGLAHQEEAYIGNWSKYLPVVAGSERAYVTFLNRMRADVFDSLAASLAIDGKPSIEEAKAIAHFVNVATGRGSFGSLEPAAVPLAQFFFAPKFVVSRVQLALGQPLWGQPGNVKKALAKEYGRMAVGALTFYAMYMLAHAVLYPEDELPYVGKTPTSADLGKVVAGRHRIDPLAGVSQIVVFLSRLIQGKSTSPTGKVTRLRGPKATRTSNIGTTVWRFERGKVSPWVSATLDVASLGGEDEWGNLITPESIVLDMVMPLSFRDVYESLQDDHFSRGVANSILSILGFGHQRYGPRKKKKK